MSEEVVLTWKEQEDKTEPIIGKSLTIAQRNELRKLLHSFDSIIRDSPGRTTLVDQIITGDTPPRLQHDYLYIVFHMRIEKL
jgi:hypothetical protein